MSHKPYIFVEAFAGSAAVTYWLLGGKPPISYMGGKSGYSACIAAILGLSQRNKPAGIVLCEPGPFAAVHATLGGASGSAEEVAGWLTCAAQSYKQGIPESGFNPTAGYGSKWTSGVETGFRPPTDPPKVAASVESSPMPASHAVANIIRSWKDEEPRALWERLKAKGWPSLLLPEGCRGRWLGPCDVQDVCEWLTCAGQAYKPGQPESGFATGRVIETRRPESSWLTAENIAPAVESLPTFPPLAVWQGVAEDLALPADLTGVFIFADPPYKGDITTGGKKPTGYKHGDCSRETVLRLAREWSARGAVVAICESVRLDADLGEGWFAVDISHARKGQVRSFTRNQGDNRKEPEEWVTLNRPPQYVPPKQQGLFG